MGREYLREYILELFFSSMRPAMHAVRIVGTSLRTLVGLYKNHEETVQKNVGLVRQSYHNYAR